jgi:ferredoxin--NADP+ reductase
MPIGTPDSPLRVAIIGSGPSGFYAADHLQKQKDLAVEIDMFDRLPTPFGLVRGGVAPDHQKIKSVTKVYEKIAADPRFRFYGNVEFGRDLTRADLRQHYHAVIYAVGAQSDKRMGIPGEDLPGSHPATDFVAWYNAHPDFCDCRFDLSVQSAAVVGLGNVAMDVIRILAKTPEELATTDIADYALEALHHSRIRTIYVLGRRGPAQAAFTNPEIKELGELADAEVIIAPEDVTLDALSQQLIDSGEDKTAIKNVEILREYAARGATGKSRQIVIRFLVSPVELVGNDRLEAVRIVKNELVQDEKGGIRPRATDQYETLPVGLIFRSVGYNGLALPDVPFDDQRGVIPNDKGRVQTAGGGQTVIGDYVVGWIKRGPSGIIGTNKPDSVETVECLLEDIRAGALPAPDAPARAALEALLAARGVTWVTFADWQLLDALETKRGAEQGRPRVKFSRVDEMLAAIRAAKSETQPEAGD